jgi:hypothetical protein
MSYNNNWAKTLSESYIQNNRPTNLQEQLDEQMALNEELLSLVDALCEELGIDVEDLLEEDGGFLGRLARGVERVGQKLRLMPSDEQKKAGAEARRVEYNRKREERLAARTPEDSEADRARSLEAIDRHQKYVTSLPIGRPNQHDSPERQRRDSVASERAAAQRQDTNAYFDKRIKK